MTLLSRFRPLTRRLALTACAATCCVSLASAQLGTQPTWLERAAVGAGLNSGLSGFVLDAAGNSFITGTSGSSGSTSILTVAYDSAGNMLWSQTFNSGQSDQARALSLGPNGLLYVAGNTPGPASFADPLVLIYDPVSGALLNTIQRTQLPFNSEIASSVVADAAGNVYVAGNTTGDGGDALMMKFDPIGQLVWRQTWDGPATSPFSSDFARQIQLDPAGDPVILAAGVWFSNQPDFVVFKLSAATGAFLWVTNWGTNASESGVDMAIDNVGDIYVTGRAFNVFNRFSTLKLEAATGAVLWQAFDSSGAQNFAGSVLLDGLGGVYIAGSSDPDGNASNANNNVLAVKRDAATGALLWTYEFGANCVGCSDGASALAVDSAGNLYMGGRSSSPPLLNDMIVIVLDAATGTQLELRSVASGPFDRITANVLELDSAGRLYAAGERDNFNTGQTDMQIAQYVSLTGAGPSLGTNYCTAVAVPNSTGAVGRMSASGSASVGDNDVTLHATDLSTGSFGYFLTSMNQGLVIQPGMSQGNLCLAGSVGRYSGPGQIMNSGTTGEIALQVDLAMTPTPLGPVSIQVGETWNFQLWHRDSVGGALTSNFTDALELQFQ